MNYETVSFWRGQLPHWEVVDGHYFVTLRLANSLPHKVAEELSSDLTKARKDGSAHRAYFIQIEKWLDSGYGTPLLKNHLVADCLIAAAVHYQNIGYWIIYAMVVMPTHIHMLLRCEALSLSNAMRGYKRYTARKINSLLNRDGKCVWQHEWFDHWTRSRDEDDRITSYIRNNPVKAGLVGSSDEWKWII
jgi:REP element-mobilizing transposase RayT